KVGIVLFAVHRLRRDSLVKSAMFLPVKFHKVAWLITQVRCSWHASIIFICCCIPIIFGSSAPADRVRSLGWVLLSPVNSPPPRSYLAMTYDPASGRIIAFGGDNGTSYLNDTWTFNGTGWTQIAAHSSDE